MTEPRKGLVERLFAEHGRALQAFFYRRIRTKSDAPDLAQEVYVRMLRVSDIHAIRNPERYLYTVASNLVKEYAALDRWQARGVDLDETSIQQRLGKLPTLVVRSCYQPRWQCSPFMGVDQREYAATKQKAVG
jgi:DNA-directed RNA polymerase specialized sigma24 family protein